MCVIIESNIQYILRELQRELTHKSLADFRINIHCRLFVLVLMACVLFVLKFFFCIFGIKLLQL